MEGKEEEKEREGRETPIADKQEHIEDIYVLILREWEEEEDVQDIVDSVVTELDTAPLPTQPAIQPLTPEQAQDEQTSKQVGLFLMSLFVFLCLASIPLQVNLILNPPIATIILIPKSQTISLNAPAQLAP